MPYAARRKGPGARGQRGSKGTLPSFHLHPPPHTHPALTRAVKVLRLVRLGEDVDVRQLEAQHGLECEERARNELGGVRTVVRVDEVDSDEAQVEGFGEARE